MSAVTELARRLGKAIAETREAQAMKQTRKDLEDDADLQKVMETFGRQMQKIQQLEQDNKPVEVDDKHRLADLEKQLAASEKFKRYSAAQVDFYDMMRKVNQALRAELQGIEED